MALFKIPNLPKNEVYAISLAIGVVILSVIAIVAFAFTGGSALFYVIAIVAIALGFYMAYSISQQGGIGTQTGSKSAASKRARR